MTRIRTSLVRLAVVATALAGQAGTALAQSCAMCSSSFGQNDPVQRAFSWSILFLMAAPYTIVGVVGGYLFYTYRRGPRRDRASIIDLAGRARRLRRFVRARPTEGDIA